MKKDDLELLGGASEVAKLCGVARSTVAMWFMPKERGGLGGNIPYKRAKIILAFALKHHLKWTLEYVIGDDDRAS